MRVVLSMRLNANAVITNDEGRFLLVRLKKGPFAGGLCILGGGVEPGEFGFVTAKREIEEETGIRLLAELKPFGFCELIGKDIGGDHRVVMLFHARAEGEPRETDEGHAAWWAYEQADRNLIPFARESIRAWREGRNHFSLLNKDCIEPAWK